MQLNYPAAHSMDTCFFAVDRDGHVAIFDTHEAGALPEIAFSGNDAHELRRQFARMPRVESLHDPSGHLIPGHAQTPHHGRRGSDNPILMFLASLDPVRDEIAAGRAAEIPATESAAVRFKTLPEALSQRLHDSGVCLGCEWHFTDPEMEEAFPDLAARGLYCYSHLTENWISGPYGRVKQPARPIHVDELPPELREAVKAMRFDSLCFAETPHIQPVEHAHCFSWEPAYMDVTGKHIRPFPGKESEYAEAFGELDSIASEEDVEVEPPSGSDPNATGE